ncbi:putative thioesterase [Phytophthora cinnamomi]|uniref:putative thioesterase n=1 Tax=Phytophthora cinnamomi TaxID=4785 RepID=UPI00355A5413|nr:putative thioesterase [Phytophthora cinnamomi]KAG6622597.1 putative thioesterase [Phytophthora cinnamomi]
MVLSRKVVAFLLLALPPTAVSALSYVVGGASGTTALGVGLLSGFAFCDLWYFLRMGLDALTPPPRGPRRHLLATSKVPGRVWLMDIDRNGHCNNARFLRECGFGRRALWQGNGVWTVVTAAGGNLVVGSQTVRYRRELSFGQAYTLQSRLLCWDKRAFYVEHRFVTRGPKGEFVNAIVLVKNSVLGPLSPEQIVAKLPALQADEEAKPPMPADVAAWIESNDASSKMLRAEAAALQ